MKTMTCRDLGGPCDAVLTANTPDEMMAKAKEHVHAVKDAGHEKIIEKIQAMTDAESEKFKADFMVKWDAAK